MSNRFYAVARGRSIGIFNDWATCSLAIQEYPKSLFKSFKEYGAAVSYLKQHNVHQGTDLMVRQIEQEQKQEQQEAIATKKRVLGVEDNPDAPPAKRPFVDGKEISVYTDGSCLGNGQKHGSVIAGAGAWFGRDDPRNVSCLVPGAQTNNRAEIYAVFKALEQCKPRSHVVILSDSLLTIRGATKQYKRKTNLDLFTLVDQMAAKMATVRYVKVLAHSGIEGNEMADALAKQACYRALRTAALLVDPLQNNPRSE